MTFNPKIAAHHYSRSGEFTMYYLRDDGVFVGNTMSVTSNNGGNVNTTVSLTGWTKTARDGSLMAQTVSARTDEFIELADWHATGEVDSVNRNIAQEQVNLLIRNNQTIMENNLLCARFAHHLTAEQRQTLRNLQSRLIERNQYLQDAELVQNTVSAAPEGYANFAPYLDNLMQEQSVGAISATAAVVITAIVLMTASAAAYYCYKRLAEESKQDVKYSNELTKILVSKLTPAEYQQLVNETGGLITKAKLKTRFATKGNLLLLAGAGLLGAFIISKIRE